MLGQPRERERERRIGAGLVVHEELVVADVGDAHDLRLAELVHHDAHLAVGAEADRLAVLQVDEHVGPGVLVEDRVERAVVEDVAVLVHLDERRALVLVRPAEHLRHVLAVHVVRAGDEASPPRRARPRSG